MMRSYGEFPNNSLCEQLASSGGSRISHRGHVDPLGSVDLQRRCFSGENVCKNKRIGSHRGACTRHAPLDPPMTSSIVNDRYYNTDSAYAHMCNQ